MSHKQRAIECIGHIEGAGKASITDRAADIRAVRDEAEAALRRMVSTELKSLAEKYQVGVPQDERIAGLKEFVATFHPNETKAAIDAEAKAVAAELDAERTESQHRAWISNMETGGPVGNAIREDYAAPDKSLTQTATELGVPPKSAKPAPKKKAKP